MILNEPKKEIQKNIMAVVRSGQFILGPRLEELENKIAQLVGVRHAIGVNSGTDALFLSLKALNICADDEVITTPFTFVAAAEAIVLAGAKPVFADIDRATFNINPALIEKAVTKKTKVIIPVHLYGQMADMGPILKIAKKHKLFVIEDAAQALGASQNLQPTTYNLQPKMAGSVGHLGCFSFFPTKNLGAFGDAGMITTNSSTLAKKLRMLRNHGSEKKYRHEILGLNSRLDEIQAAVLLAKLPYLKKWNERRRTIAKIYGSAFAKNTVIKMPAVLPGNYHIFHQYTLYSPHHDIIVKKLAAAGIPAAIHYPAPLHLQPAFQYLGYKRGDFPEAEKAAREVFSLPIYPELTKKEIDEIIKKVLDLA